jgi:hypothetical protein
MALIHIINGLNGGIIKWREPELVQQNVQKEKYERRKSGEIKNQRETMERRKF